MSFEMNKTQTVVCSLIADALFGKKHTYSGEIDWNAVHTEMCAQTVHGLVMDVLPGLPVPEELKKTWAAECLMVMRSGIRLRHEQGAFLRILENANIPYVVLKGTSAAMYYPNPLLRGMGDVDVYVPEHFHEEAARLLKETGYSMKENEHYKRHVQFFKNDTEFEVHRTFATINGPEEKAYIDGLIEACTDPEKALRVGSGESAFYAPETLVNGLVLLEHIGQHMRAGLGLRQIIDWMMFAKAHLGDGWGRFLGGCRRQPGGTVPEPRREPSLKDELEESEWISFSEMAEKAGLLSLAKAVTRMCVMYFGLEGDFGWCMDADEETAQEILAYLFDSGNFGRKTMDVSRASVVSKRMKDKNVFAALQLAGECNWKLYKRHRWLRPFAWIYQTFRYVKKVLTSRDGIRTLRKGAVEADRRERLMSRLEIYRGE